MRATRTRSCDPAGLCDASVRRRSAPFARAALDYWPSALRVHSRCHCWLPWQRRYRTAADRWQRWRSGLGCERRCLTACWVTLRDDVGCIHISPHPTWYCWQEEICGIGYKRRDPTDRGDKTRRKAMDGIRIDAKKTRDIYICWGCVRKLKRDNTAIHTYSLLALNTQFITANALNHVSWLESMLNARTLF